jgi:hypothetical protein
MTDIIGLKTRRGIVGPWECEKCHQISQFCDIGATKNRVFCRNPSCDYTRLIDKKHNTIREDDGTVWMFDSEGNKTRIRA